MTTNIEEEAKLRSARHAMSDNQRILAPEYELRGLRGEQALGLLFNKPVDLTARLEGDGGKDFHGRFRCKDGAVRLMKVDVKTSARNYGLLVEASKCQINTIYVYAYCPDVKEAAELLGWEIGSIVKTYPKSDTGRGIINYNVPLADLRPIHELIAIYVG